MSIGDNYRRLRREVPGHVTIVLAAKTRTPQEVLEALEAGATDIGENYVQEAGHLYTALGEKARSVTWHMIGELQKNKINRALQVFDVIQTVDSLEKAEAINSRAERAGTLLKVYVEVNIGSEPSKSGVVPGSDAVESLVENITQLRHLSIDGIMTMGPLTGDPENSRPYFREARKIFDRINARGLPGVSLTTLSMGMSNSYRVAIEEGATMIRLGTIVFGTRRRQA